MIDEIAAEYNKGTLLLEKLNYKKAMASFKKCLAQHEFKEAYVNIGNCYRHFGMDSKMMESYKRALDPKVPYLQSSSTQLFGHALNNLGLAYYMRGDDDLAIECYERAIEDNPKFWEAWWNCSTAVLRKASSGDISLFKDGWDMYDARFLKAPPIKMKNDKPSLVYWDRVTPGSSIVVLAEQGIGDAIMWGRYLPLLAEKFSSVYVQCDASTREIFAPEYKTVTMPSECNAEVAIPMCALSKCFPSSIPPGDWLRDKFSTFDFSNTTEKLNVGIVWSGSSTHANDHNRSIPIHRFHALSKFVNLYSLSPNFKGNKYVSALDIQSWSDTAKYINGLDLVITVDTSVAHMAASLGGRVWLLQPLKETDFRWGNNVTRSVWYPNVRIFNNPNDWSFVFDQVTDALKSELYI